MAALVVFQTELEVANLFCEKKQFNEINFGTHSLLRLQTVVHHQLHL